MQFQINCLFLQELFLAKISNVYNKLTYTEVSEYLSNRQLNFDYFISTDVFVYVGKLSSIFHLIKTRNMRSGKLVFSTEHNYNDVYQLEKSGRYYHSKSYIEGLCSQFGYEMIHFSKVKLRKEKGNFLCGAIYILGF